MVREKRSLPSTASNGAKQRHRRKNRSMHGGSSSAGLVAKPSIPKIKHHTYFEFVENKDKKRKLESKESTNISPPPGYQFVPVGNPRLTKICKELSREKDAMMFIISKKIGNSIGRSNLSHQMNRLGYHFRETIVQEAKLTLVDTPNVKVSSLGNGKPEPLPESQEVYNTQANDTILDLFPRIPNFDREFIIEWSFNLALKEDYDPPVGLCPTIALSRRVQLAVLAHIRHTHTTYDQLLKKTSWANARKIVEPLCLDILVKWRGDEETGRDQLDEILREVVVISDSEDGDSESDTETDGSSIEEVATDVNESQPVATNQVALDRVSSHLPQETQQATQEEHPRPSGHRRKESKKENRGFKRYRAWEEAIRRNRGEQPSSPHLNGDGPTSHRDHQGSGDLPPLPEQRDSMGAMGAMPLANGFVPRPAPTPTPAAPIVITSSPPCAMSVVNSPQYEQVPRHNAPSQHVTPAANRFQDMLVRSVEVASPDNIMQPSFVRALPPRMHVSPRRQDDSCHFGFTTSSLHATRDSGRATNDDTWTHGYTRPHVATSHGYNLSESRVSPTREFYSVAPAHATRPAPYPLEPAFPNPRSHQGSSGLPARTILVETGRRGERSNPMLMEDRGGFYEIVPVSSGGRSNQIIREGRGGVSERVNMPSGHRPHPIVMEDRGGFFERVNVPPNNGYHDTVHVNRGPSYSGVDNYWQRWQHYANGSIPWDDGSRAQRDGRDMRTGVSQDGYSTANPRFIETRSRPEHVETRVNDPFPGRSGGYVEQWPRQNFAPEREDADIPEESLSRPGYQPLPMEVHIEVLRRHAAGNYRMT